jgi:hypothetical protein
MPLRSNVYSKGHYISIKKTRVLYWINLLRFLRINLEGHFNYITHRINNVSAYAIYSPEPVSLV